MIDNKIVILCPEIVPLDNKGEEAIIKGVMDIKGLKEDNCIYQVIDPSVRQLTVRNGLYLHPSELFFSEWRTKEYGLGLSMELIYNSVCAVVRHGLNHLYPQWINKRPSVVKRLIQYIKWYREGKTSKIPKKVVDSVRLIANTDYIIAGHNGGLNENVCHLLLAFNEIGYHYTIFGSCMKPRVKEKFLLQLYDNTFSKSDNIISRNPIGFRWYQSHFDYPAELKPDPAFYMNALNKECVDQLIEKLGLVRFFTKKVIMITTAEPAPISLRAFDDYSTRIQKISAHRKFLASLLKRLLDETDLNVLFLPHTIGPQDNMDDRKISKDAVRIAKLSNDSEGRCFVLEADLDCRQLKGLISKAEILVAERVHSLIGAVGVHTPFICLASDKDTRVNGMLIELAGLGEYVYHLNHPVVDEAMKKILFVMNNRASISEKIAKLDENNRMQLNLVGNEIIIPRNERTY